MFMCTSSLLFAVKFMELLVLQSASVDGACPSGRFGMHCLDECHCSTGGDCDELTGECDSGCAAGYYGHGCQLKNLARGMSTDHYGSLPSSRMTMTSLAVDGSPVTCSQTSRGSSPWWRVDLLAVYSIYEVSLMNGQGSDLRDYAVRVTNSTSLDYDYQTCFFRRGAVADGATENITCWHAVYGRYLYILVNNGTSQSRLSLCEVDVIGKFMSDLFGGVPDVSPVYLPASIGNVYPSPGFPRGGQLSAWEYRVSGPGTVFAEIFRDDDTHWKLLYKTNITASTSGQGIMHLQPSERISIRPGYLFGYHYPDGGRSILYVSDNMFLQHIKVHGFSNRDSSMYIGFRLPKPSHIRFTRTPALRAIVLPPVCSASYGGPTYLNDMYPSDNKMSIFPNYRIPSTGRLMSWTFNAGNVGRVWAAIWRPIGEESFTLVHKLRIDVAKTGEQIVNVNQDVAVKSGDVIGYHYASGSEGVIRVKDSPGSNDSCCPGVSTQEYFSFPYYDHQFRVGFTLHIQSGHAGRRRTSALQALVVFSDPSVELTVIDMGASYVTTKFQTLPSSYTCISSMSHYAIEYKEINDTTWLQGDPKIPHRTDLTYVFRDLHGLSPNTEYNLRVVAYIIHGATAVIATAATMTDCAAPPPATDLQLTPTMDGSNLKITASWNPPVSVNCETITGYHISMKRTGSLKWSDATSTVDTIHTFSNLDGYQSYTVGLLVLNGEKHSKWLIRSVVTLQTAPTSPTNVTAFVNETLLQVVWSPPDPSNGIIIGYKILVWPETDITSIITRHVDGNTIYLNHGRIKPLTLYSIQVYAKTIVGYGNSSQIQVAADLLPDTPIYLVNTSRSDEWLHLKWKISETMGAVIQFKVVCSILQSLLLTPEPGQREQIVKVTNQEERIFYDVIHGLLPATQHRCCVAALNGQGYGQHICGLFWTSPSGPSISSTNRPDFTLDDRRSTNTTVTLHLGPFTRNDGLPVSAYRVIVEEINGIGIVDLNKQWHLLVDYDSARRRNLSVYIAASFTSQYIGYGEDFVVGTSGYYGNYQNAPLRTGKKYQFWYGIMTTVDGDVAHTYISLENGPITVKAPDVKLVVNKQERTQSKTERQTDKKENSTSLVGLSAGLGGCLLLATIVIAALVAVLRTRGRLHVNYKMNGEVHGTCYENKLYGTDQEDNEPQENGGPSSRYSIIKS